MQSRGASVAVLCVALVACGVSRALDIAVDSEFQLGPDKWWSDVSSVSVVPMPELSLVVSGGRAMTATPVSDRAESLGAAVSADVGYGFRATVGWASGEGIRLAGGRRESHGLWSLDLAVRAIDRGGAEAEEQEAFLKSLTLALGATTGTHRMPVASGEARVRDRTMTAGVTAELEANTLSVTAASHGYGWPAGADRGLMDALFGASPDMVGTVFAGLPDWDVGISYREQLPWQASSITVGYVYTRLASPVGLVRTISAELGWPLAGWLTLRGGALWLRYPGETTRFLVAGVSMFF